jgi:hypothetical protein
MMMPFIVLAETKTSQRSSPPPPHAHSFVIGPAVIKHTHRTYVAPRVNAYACFAGLSRLYKCRASSVAASATTRVPETASRSSSMPPCGADGPPPSSFRTCATCGGLAAGWGSQEVGGKGLRRRAGGVGSRGTMQMPVLNTEGVLASFLEGGTRPSGMMMMMMMMKVARSAVMRSPCAGAALGPQGMAPNIALFLSLSVSLRLSLSLSVSLRLSPSLSVSLCLSLSLSVSLCLSLSLSVSLCLSLSLSVSLRLSLSLSVSLRLSPSLSVSLRLSPSLSVSLRLSPSLSVSLRLSPSLSVSLFASAHVNGIILLWF